LFAHVQADTTVTIDPEQQSPPSTAGWLASRAIVAAWGTVTVIPL
jgi:hypothetical protein